MAYNESNAESTGSSSAPLIVKDAGQPSNENAAPTELGLILKQLKIITQVLIVGLNVPEGDANIGDDETLTTG